MQHAANTAEFLAAAGAAGAAVHEMRQRRAVAGGIGGAVGIDDEDAAVKGRKPRHEARGRGIIGAEDRRDEAAAAAPRKLYRLIRTVIGEERAHRSKGLHRVHRACARRVAAVKQRRGEKCATLRIGSGRLKGKLAAKYHGAV
jgi:hypothetical protein